LGIFLLAYFLYYLGVSITIFMRDDFGCLSKSEIRFLFMSNTLPNGSVVIFEPSRSTWFKYLHKSFGK